MDKTKEKGGREGFSLMNLFVLDSCLLPPLIVESIGDDGSFAHTFTDAHANVLRHHLTKEPAKIKSILSINGLINWKSLSSSYSCRNILYM